MKYFAYTTSYRQKPLLTTHLNCKSIFFDTVDLSNEKQTIHLIQKP